MENLLKLEKQLCFKIYAFSRMITKEYKPFLDEINLTYPQYLVMIVLWESKSLSVKDLGEKLYLDSGTLTPLLKKLEVKELVLRKRDASDERIVNIYLSEKGEKLEEKARDIPKKMIETGLVNDEEFQFLSKILNEILIRDSKY